MLNLGLHLNDAELTLVSQGNIVYREPGYAMIDNEEFSFGNKAYKHARTNPRQIHNRFWSDLSLTPSSNKKFHNLSRADIASYHLEEILQFFPNAKVINLVRDQRDVLLSQKNKWKRRGDHSHKSKR